MLCEPCPAFGWAVSWELQMWMACRSHQQIPVLFAEKSMAVQQQLTEFASEV